MVHFVHPSSRSLPYRTLIAAVCALQLIACGSEDTDDSGAATPDGSVSPDTGGGDSDVGLPDAQQQDTGRDDVSVPEPDADRPDTADPGPGPDDVTPGPDVLPDGGTEPDVLPDGGTEPDVEPDAVEDTSVPDDTSPDAIEPDGGTSDAGGDVAPDVVEPPGPRDVIIDLESFETLRLSGAQVYDARPALQYTDGHIPGAINLSSSAFNAPDRNGIVYDSAETLQGIARNAGLRNDTPVLVYGNWGDGAASTARLFWTFEYLGHDEVYLLDGNFDDWKELGIPVDTTPVIPTPSDFEVDLRSETRATLSEIVEFITSGDPRVVLIDTRTLEEWLGDNLRGNPRGGHIPTAVHYHWLDLFDLTAGTLLPREQILAGLAERGITEESIVIPYCQSGVRSAFFYALLRDLGWPAPRNFDGSFWEWSRAEDLPIIVEGDEEPPPSGVIIDVTAFEVLRAAGATVYDARAALQYTDGHVPGAINLSWNAFTAPDRNGLVRESVDELQTIARANGLNNDTPVLIYGAWGDGAATPARLFWTLEYLGHSAVYLLDGGIDAWKDLGIPVETAPVVPVEGDFVVTLRPEIRATLPEIVEIVTSGDPNVVLIDTRTLEEWLGDNLRGNPRGGHIPNAVHYHWLDLFNLTDGVLLPEADILAGLSSRGITEDSVVVPYCQSGVRSAFFYALLRDLGWPSPRNYDGSFWEWSRAEDLPVIVEGDAEPPPPTP